MTSNSKSSPRYQTYFRVGCCHQPSALKRKFSHETPVLRDKQDFADKSLQRRPSAIHVSRRNPFEVLDQIVSSPSV